MAQEIDLGKVAGAGVPAGGKAGQVLVKVSDADYDTEWQDMGAALPNAAGEAF